MVDGGLLPIGVNGFLVLLIAGFAMTEPWRWAGVWLARDIDVDSEIFRWVRAVSTALVAGLVARMVVFPSGALADVSAATRIGAFLGCIAIYFLLARRVSYGIQITTSVTSGIVLLFALRLAFG